MQHLEGSGTPVLYIGRTVLKGETYIILQCTIPNGTFNFPIPSYHHVQKQVRTKSHKKRGVTADKQQQNETQKYRQPNLNTTV